MIRMVPSTSAGHAKSYFSDALSKSDYYINDTELEGHFNGKLGERLGINGKATKEVFFALSENRHPETGKPLTPITKDGRVVGYDINFHCPKSVSVVHALSEDDHILDAFRLSVADTMKDIEADSKTRVRKDGRYEDRETGELVYADFVHQTSRPVDGQSPDPHLHSHCFVMNMTFDQTEGKIKAAKFRDIVRSSPYYTARFQKRLSDRLVDLGYQIRVTDKAFEIEGVPQKVIDHFSKRTNEIGRVAKEKGITNADELDKLGARTRSKKQKGQSMAELKADWRRQIREISKDIDINEKSKSVRFAKKKEPVKLEPQACVDYGIKHHFERASVVEDRKILASAYKYTLGNTTVSVDEVTKSFYDDDTLIRISQGSQKLCTTKEVLSEEKRMVDLARKGHGRMTPLYKTPPSLKVDGEQAEAIRHVLTTSNQVSIIRGAAGTGKTTLMKEAVELMGKAGKQVTVVAPTGQAARGVLRDEGFKEADTVARLLVDKQLQDALEGQVLWIDEAGLMGSRDMAAVLEIVTNKNARLILGGDSRQHSSVQRGDALRVLSTVGGIRSAEVSRIFRQKNLEYRSAVEDLSKGDVGTAFQKLDRMGAIKNIDPMKAGDGLVDDYLKVLKNGKTALVISPTHKQGEDTTAEIRQRLRQARMIGKKEIKVTRLANTNLTEAERSDWKNFKKGQVIQFNQNLKGIKRGSTWTVNDVSASGVKITGENGGSTDLPISKSGLYDVFDKKEIGLSKGDKVRVTRNGFDKNDRRLNNGQTLEVASVKKKGRVVLKNAQGIEAYELDDQFGHIAHAHCITSHSSQGMTVDEVIIAQPSATFGATNAKQFYVSVSRGREKVTVYTDDKDALLANASETGERQSALELVHKGYKHEDYAHHQARSEHVPKDKPSANVKGHHQKTSKERDYGPEI